MLDTLAATKHEDEHEQGRNSAGPPTCLLCHRTMNPEERGEERIAGLFQPHYFDFRHNRRHNKVRSFASRCIVPAACPCQVIAWATLPLSVAIIHVREQHSVTDRRPWRQSGAVRLWGEYKEQRTRIMLNYVACPRLPASSSQCTATRCGCRIADSSHLGCGDAAAPSEGG